jgi:spermidine synthase
MRQLKTDTTSSNLIYHVENEFGSTCVYQNNEHIWLTLNNNPQSDVIIQGVMNKVSPEKVCVAIYQSMLLFLLIPINDLRILNLGLGTAGLERTLKHIESNTPYLSPINLFESVEINPAIVSIAKQFFQLPNDHTVHLQCAEQFISLCNQKYDIIYIDIFSGEYHQAFIQSHSFWQSINRCIDENGQAVINLNPQTGQDLKNILVLLRQYFECIALIEFNEYSNIVLILSHKSLKYISIEAIHASKVMQVIAPKLHNAINTIYHIEIE